MLLSPPKYEARWIRWLYRNYQNYRPKKSEGFELDEQMNGKHSSHLATTDVSERRANELLRSSSLIVSLKGPPQEESVVFCKDCLLPLLFERFDRRNL